MRKKTKTNSCILICKTHMWGPCVPQEHELVKCPSSYRNTRAQTLTRLVFCIHPQWQPRIRGRSFYYTHAFIWLVLHKRIV